MMDIGNIVEIILCILAVLAGFVVILTVMDNTMSEQTKYDLAASSMEVEGYTDLEIFMELGPRPKNEEPK